jgi:uncharacterized protein
MNDNKIIITLKENIDLLKKYHVKKIGLFGSYVRGEQTKKSDIDLLVEFDEDSFGKNYFGYFDSVTSLAADLQNIFKDYVDLITPDMLSPYFADSVFKEVKYIEGL